MLDAYDPLRMIPSNQVGSGWTRPLLHSRFWRGHGTGWWLLAGVCGRPYGHGYPGSLCGTGRALWLYGWR